MLRVLAATFVALTFLSGCAIPSAKNVDPQDAARVDAVVNAVEASVAELCEHPDHARDFVTCEFNAKIIDGSSPQALVTARGVHVSKGMLRAARSESELAFVIGHEAAHVALGHLHSLPSRNVKDIEMEADEYGLLFAAHAGYDPQASIRILTRVENAVARNRSVGFTTHPSFGERRAALERWVRALDRQGTVLAENLSR